MSFKETLFGNIHMSQGTLYFYQKAYNVVAQLLQLIFFQLQDLSRTTIRIDGLAVFQEAFLHVSLDQHRAASGQPYMVEQLNTA